MDSNLTIIWLCNSMCTDFRRCGEIDEEMKQKLNEMYVGRLIHIFPMNGVGGFTYFIPYNETA